jgi:hypothetical protein
LARAALTSNCAALLGVFGGVVQQVDQNLDKPREIAAHDQRHIRQRRPQLMLAPLDERTGALDRLGDSDS